MKNINVYKNTIIVYRCFLFFLLLSTQTFFSQVTAIGHFWDRLDERTKMTNVNNDPDSGDGVGDGAIYVDGTDKNELAGASLTFGGTMVVGQENSIEVSCYNFDPKWVTVRVELWNKTDNKRVLHPNTSAETFDFDKGTVSNPYELPAMTYKYVPEVTDAGDVLELRFFKKYFFDTDQNFAIDYVKINGATVPTLLPNPITHVFCKSDENPDIELPTLSTDPLVNDAIDQEINTILERVTYAYLGNGVNKPLDFVNGVYNSLNIAIDGDTISGNPVGVSNGYQNEKKYSIINNYAKHLRANPNDLDAQEKARNVIWLSSQQFCEGSLGFGNSAASYAFKDLGGGAIFLYSILTPTIVDSFRYLLNANVENDLFWEPNYDHNFIVNKRAINNDMLYNLAYVQLAYAGWFDTLQERHRYMLGFKRYMERYLSYTDSRKNGIKLDGSGVHHAVAYNQYMYSYNSAIDILHYLKDTRFQVSVESYKVLRNAIYYQFMQSNDDGVQALSTTGRNPFAKMRTIKPNKLRSLAIIGGNILGLGTADPILAGLYNRLYGVDSAFNDSTVSPDPQGFFQINHAHAGFYRKDGWLAFNKGFTSYSFGVEIYKDRNRYGRYQSYGALEVIYPGNKNDDNGYDHNTWDWRFNPGATTIKLPWNKMQAWKARDDQWQNKNFAGALTFEKKGSEVLTNNHGTYGMFAMDFDENSKYAHNFTFKKSSFYLDDMIVCLGSDLKNTNALSETVTTLYQRMANKGSVFVNGTQETGNKSYTGASNNWVLSNYNTGFYVLPGDATLKVKKEFQQTPNYWVTDASDDGSGNSGGDYYTGYLDHGTAPTNKGYEYIMKPATNTSEMEALHTSISSGSKPYEVHQKDNNAHVLEYKSKNIWGYAVFDTVTDLIVGKVKSVNAQCLLMIKDKGVNGLLVSIVDPDIGYGEGNGNTAIERIKEVAFDGEWSLKTTYTGVKILSTSSTETVVEFTIKDGLSTEVELVNIGMSTEKFEVDNISVYPNPVSSVLNISTRDDIQEYSIIDVMGKIIRKKQSINNKVIDVSTIDNGVYLISLFNEEGHESIKKLVISK